MIDIKCHDCGTDCEVPSKELIYCVRCFQNHRGQDNNDY